MVNKSHLTNVVLIGVVALVLTGISMWMLWEARSQKGTCTDLSKDACIANQHCLFLTDEMGVSACKRDHTVDRLAVFYVFGSLCLWIKFLSESMKVVSDEPDEIDWWIVCVGISCVYVATAVSAYLAAMWFVLGSKTALIFSIICSAILVAFVSGSIVRVVSYYKIDSPPSYDMLQRTDEPGV